MVRQTLLDLSGDKFRRLEHRDQAILTPNFQAQEDRLADIGESRRQVLPLRHAARNGGTDDRVPATGLGLEGGPARPVVASEPQSTSSDLPM